MLVNLDNCKFAEQEQKEILRLLNSIPKNIKEPIQKLWFIMDMVWDELECDNRQLNWENIGKFYDHPVWLINGVFSEQDLQSQTHRNLIAHFVNTQQIENVLDYGGGFGVLSRVIAIKNPRIKIDIFEPHPTDYARAKLENFPNVQYISEVTKKYDLITCVDVLEHVPDPISDLIKLSNMVDIGGTFVIANAFYPMIKCHLPHNFFLRHTFNIYCRLLGLRKIEKIEGTHATAYVKCNDVSFGKTWLDVCTIFFKAIYNSKTLTFIDLSKRFAKWVLKK